MYRAKTNKKVGLTIKSDDQKYDKSRDEFPIMWIGNIVMTMVNIMD